MKPTSNMHTPSDQLTVPPDGKPFRDQPQWRNDFPIDRPQDEYVSRRDFTKFLVLTSFAFVVGQVWIVGQNVMRRRRGLPPVKKIAALSALPPVGGAMVFQYPGAGDNCLLIRTGEESFVAYDQKCTHLACAVVPEFDKNRIHCPCHSGYFDLETGNVLAGPPQRPLIRVTLEIRDDVLYATGIEVRSS
jgi:Rieske Fe-S protein